LNEIPSVKAKLCFSKPSWKFPFPKLVEKLSKFWTHFWNRKFFLKVESEASISKIFLFQKCVQNPIFFSFWNALLEKEKKNYFFLNRRFTFDFINFLCSKSVTLRKSLIKLR
jgi:hypothetical protein